MKKILTTGILISLCIQQFMLPMNIASAAPVEQKSFLSLIGKEANYRNLFDKILAFDMTSQMSSRQENGSANGATIRESGRYISINDFQGTKIGILDSNGIPSDFDVTQVGKINKSIAAYRSYSYKESAGTPGVVESRKYDETDTVQIAGRSTKNTGIGRIWVASGATVRINTQGTLGYSSKYTYFYRWGKPIDHNVAQAAHNEIQRYSMGWRELPPVPVNPSYYGTPMAFMNDEASRARHENFYLKDGKEISDTEMTTMMGTKILDTVNFNTLVTPAETGDFFTSNRIYSGFICGYNEGVCGGLDAKHWEIFHTTRTHPFLGGIAFTSNRNGYLYYDATFGPESYKDIPSLGNLRFDISTSTSDLKAALKSVIWDSRGDPCEAPDVTTDSVCKVVYEQSTTTNNAPIKLTLRADSGTNSNTYTSEVLANPSDIKQINVINGSVTLKWDGYSATSCTLNNQSISISGTQTFTNLTKNNTIHYLKCTNSTTNKSVSLYFTASPFITQDCFAPGSCGQGLPPVVNPYSSYISNINQQKLTKWLSNLALKSNSLGLEKYSKLIEANISRLRIIIRNTKNTNTSIMAKYLIFELQQIQDKIDENDSSFLNDLFTN